MAILRSDLILSLIDRVTGPARGVTSAVNRMQGQFKRNQAALAATQTQMVGAVAAGYAVTKAIASPTRAAMGFESSMLRVKAVSGATEEQFAALTEQAKKLGRETRFTASQVAGSQSFLGMAGFDPSKIMASVPGTLQLATAAQMDLATAADIVSNVMTGYGMEASELGRINDTLVTAFTSSNTNLQQLGDAMKYAGSVAKSAGVEFETTVAALGLMGNAGFQGTLGGTALRGAMTRILNPTKQVRDAMKSAGLSFTDANGRLLPLVDIVRELEPHAEDTGLMMQLFGQRAGPAMAALVSQGGDALEELSELLKDAEGNADRIAEIMNSGFEGRLFEFRSAIEGAGIALGNALFPALTSLFNSLKPVIGAITTFAEVNPKLTATVVTLTASLVALRVAAIALKFAFFWMRGAYLATAIAGLTGLTKAARAATFAFLPLKGAVGGFGFLIAKAGPVGLAITALAGAGLFLKENWSGVKAMFDGIGSALADSFPNAATAVGNAVQSIMAWFDRLGERLKISDESWRAFGESVGNAIASAFDFIVSTVENALGLIETLIGKVTSAASSIGSLFSSSGGSEKAADPQAIQAAEAAKRNAALQEALRLTRELEAARAAANSRSELSALRPLADHQKAALAALPAEAMEAMGRYQAAIREGGGAVTGEARAVAAELRSTLDITVKPTIELVGASTALGQARALNQELQRLGTAARVSVPQTGVEGRARGGPITAGVPYIVGEEGRELIIPNVSGMVVNAPDTKRLLAGGSRGGVSASAGAGNVTVSVTVHGSSDPHRTGDIVAGKVQRAIARSRATNLQDRMDR